MSADFNHVNYPYYEDPSVEENHQEPHNLYYQSNVKGEGHPFFTPEGLKEFINHGRGFANSFSEKQLEGTIKTVVISEIIKSAKQLKIPVEMLIMALDWKKDMDKRDNASDAKEIGNMLKNFIPELRNIFGRDPLSAEIFAAFALEGASKLKSLIEKVEKAPDDNAEAPGTSKDDILLKKFRGDLSAARTNRELLDYFYKRIVNGKIPFLEYMSINNG